MIVRIPTEGQFELDDQEAGELNDLDNKLVALVEHGNEAQFSTVLAQMEDLVRTKGDHLPDSDLHASDIVLPPPDLTFEEAQALFKGDGLIPG